MAEEDAAWDNGREEKMWKAKEKRDAGYRRSEKMQVRKRWEDFRKREE
jgi:hypothetical protein